MQSEKIKEIKKNIEICTSRIECEECSLTPIMTSTNCRNELLKNCLTLINELESENERWQEKEGALSCDLEIISEKLTNAEIEVDDYKDRIAELTKELEKEQINNLNCDTELQYKENRIALLEKDNELLRNAKVVYENVDYCYEDLKKAEKRIAELEKENAKLNIELDKRDCIDYPCRLIEKEHLKQFAERLKEKVIRPCDLYDCVTVDDIDETLKEFIDELI